MTVSVKEVDSMSAVTMAESFDATKRSWRGTYARVVQVSSMWLTTHRPDGLLTNKWSLRSDILAVEQTGVTLVAHLAPRNCTCGLVAPLLTLELPSEEIAASLRATIHERQRVTFDNAEQSHREHLRNRYAQQARRGSGMMAPIRMGSGSRYSSESEGA